MVSSGRSQWMKGQHEKKEGIRVKARGKGSKILILKINLVNKRSVMQKTSVVLSVIGA